MTRSTCLKRIRRLLPPFGLEGAPKHEAYVRQLEDGRVEAGYWIKRAMRGTPKQRLLVARASSWSELHQAVLQGRERSLG